MFKKTKSKVLVDYASEEDDMSWHYHHSYKDKDIQGEEEDEEAVTAVSKEAKVKKIMSKKDRREKKMFSSKDDERFLLTGEKLADRKGSHKKIKDEEKEKEKKDKPEKANCFWESVTMTMRQISPAKKLEKIEGWEPPHLENFAETAPDEAPVGKSQNGDVAESSPSSLSIPATALELPSWCGRGQEEDSSRYANLLDSNDSTAAVKWTARAKVKLAGISRMSRGIVSESASVWEGFK
ncbi:testis development-related protein [Pundamilia nyererei]|uniref:Testis development-related protein n=1 Tax=Pundamilia nyererei TaxID=303518 RepID=A0A9Y3RE67_9CICH|nr:PREDICTED: testis development-related protein [Pundamilia nyererei]XP_005914586.1 si:ch211-225h24.2 [Haplochromis burtoni]